MSTPAHILPRSGAPLVHRCAAGHLQWAALLALAACAPQVHTTPAPAPCPRGYTFAYSEHRYEGETLVIRTVCVKEPTP